MTFKENENQIYQSNRFLFISFFSDHKKNLGYFQQQKNTHKILIYPSIESLKTIVLCR